jgi:hypothetical protein
MQDQSRYAPASCAVVLRRLQDASLCWGVQIHAYVLLPEAAYLLLCAPGAERLSAFSASLGGCLQARQDPRWEPTEKLGIWPRPFICQVDTSFSSSADASPAARFGRRFLPDVSPQQTRRIWREQDILALQCELEMLPVALGMVSSPTQWYWSSYACHASGQGNDLLVPHPDYLQLGSNSRARCGAYRRLCGRNSKQQSVEPVSRDAVVDTSAHPL